ncbi:MAG: hypothetical protein ACLQLC_17110 [Candidatus Sulfotelmatobacter sp.]
MKAIGAVIALLTLSGLAIGQAITGEVTNYSAPTTKADVISGMPHLFAEGGLNVSGNGYQTFAGNMGAGVGIEENHFIANAEGFYDFMRKTNDNDQVPDEKGRVRTADGEVFYKFHSGSSWFVGGGAGWSETSLTTYMKSAWNPRVGGGHDFVSEMTSWRLQVLYLRDENEVVRYPSPVQFTPGPGQSASSYTCSLCGNNVQGVEASVWFPSPSSPHHLLLHWVVTPVWFHETVTDPYNAALTHSQKSQHDVSGSYYVDLIYRF